MTIDATHTQKGERELRTVLTTCGYCQGFGRLYGGHPNDPDPSDYGTCPDCQGHGEIEVDTVAVTEEEIMEPAYDPTTQPFDEPNKHAGTAQKGEREEALLPCPFCGGDAEIVHIEEGENAGGSCVCCKRCNASSNVEFEFKENFISNWNRRSSSKAEGEMREALEKAVAALEEAEAILGGEYGDHYAVLCERMFGLRAALSPKEGG